MTGPNLVISCNFCQFDVCVIKDVDHSDPNLVLRGKKKGDVGIANIKEMVVGEET
ncbi:hypothetical protein BVRB_3g065870 [Beta vulgaris subsp. vulgaris]|uniref:Uncharacterized protein n=1 Tax=Beta vulgaris subsp. vulgaris TaxID=3555 RepID=A0A0J8CSB2_BETVV|nr:hypothetical protein BVRB_3g065870 [Beta vulgaris subsp. vulgaris]